MQYTRLGESRYDYCPVFTIRCVGAAFFVCFVENATPFLYAESNTTSYHVAAERDASGLNTAKLSATEFNAAGRDAAASNATKFSSTTRLNTAASNATKFNTTRLNAAEYDATERH